MAKVYKGHILCGVVEPKFKMSQYSPKADHSIQIFALPFLKAELWALDGGSVSVAFLGAWFAQAK